MSKIRDALFKLTEIIENPLLNRDAGCLASEELLSFDFVLSLVIWYYILLKINMVSTKLQYEYMCLDVAMKTLEALLHFMKTTEKLVLFLP